MFLGFVKFFYLYLKRKSNFFMKLHYINHAAAGNNSTAGGQPAAGAAPGPASADLLKDAAKDIPAPAAGTNAAADQTGNSSGTNQPAPGATAGTTNGGENGNQNVPGGDINKNVADDFENEIDEKTKQRQSAEMEKFAAMVAAHMVNTHGAVIVKTVPADQATPAPAQTANVSAGPAKEAVLSTDHEANVRKYGPGYINATNTSGAKTIFTAAAWKNMNGNHGGWKQVVTVPPEVAGKK